MSDFDALDPVIEKWVSLFRSKLFTEWAGEPARFFYTHGDPPFEAFQICIFPPTGDQVRVLASAVDTNDDTESEMEQDWVGPTTSLDAMLQAAATTIAGWKARTRKKPDPPSPW